MKASILITACLFVMSVSVNAGQQNTKQEQILQRYLDVPATQENRYGDELKKRLDILAELNSTPDESVDVIDKMLPSIENPLHRIGIINFLEQNIQIKKAADVLGKLLKDPDKDVRGSAIHSLRMLARRTDRSGPTRTQRNVDNRTGAEKERAMREALIRGESPQRREYIQPQDEMLYGYAEFEPKVDGLLPYLITAANDSDESNRRGALYALADSRDPLAVTQMRKMLKDSSEEVQLYAACFLTEYQDASGLFVLKSALKKFSESDDEKPEFEFEYYSQIEMLIASFERITGKSFGEIPMNPSLSSDTRQFEPLKKAHKDLLKTWSQWWAWEPN